MWARPCLGELCFYLVQQVMGLAKTLSQPIGAGNLCEQFQALIAVC